MREFRTKNGAWGIVYDRTWCGFTVMVFIAGLIFDFSIKNYRWAYYD